MGLTPPNTLDVWQLPIRDAESATAGKESPAEADVIAFFNESRNPLLRYVRSMGLPLHDGEEVVQEVFIALFQHLRQGKPRTNLKGWVFQVGHNLALKQRIRNGRRDRMHCPDEAASSVLHPQLDPEEVFAEGQRHQRLSAVVGALPETDRCCLLLRAEGLRYREIAAVLSLSLGGVSLSLGRALARLAKADREAS